MSVKLSENHFRGHNKDTAIRYGEPTGMVRMPLPSDKGRWHTRTTSGNQYGYRGRWGLNNGYRDSEGHWFAGGVYRYSIQNSGIPPEGFGKRGAGIGQLAGIVRRCE